MHDKEQQCSETNTLALLKQEAKAEQPADGAHDFTAITTSGSLENKKPPGTRQPGGLVFRSLGRNYSSSSQLSMPSADTSGY
jgi:hypothetical protein